MVCGMGALLNRVVLDFSDSLFVGELRLKLEFVGLGESSSSLVASV